MPWPTVELNHRMPPKGTANANGDKEKKNVSAGLGNFQIIGCVQKLFS